MPNWTEEQKQAIEANNTNLLVSASAGSGKTAVLVERIIQKVINNYIDVDKLLVVTFTNAAATELKEKILNAIYKKLDKEIDIKKKNHLRNQLKYINRASITTIDAFCLNVVKENFNIIDVDPNVRICEETQSYIIKNRIINNLLEERYRKYNEDNKDSNLYNILEIFDGKEELFIDSILNVYRYIQSFPYPFLWLNKQIEKYNIIGEMDLYNVDFGKDIYEDVVKEIEYAILNFENWVEEIEDISDFDKCRETLDQDIEVLKRCINIKEKSWDTLYDNLLNLELIRFNGGKPADIEKKEVIKKFRTDIKSSIIEKSKKKIYAKSNIILEDNRKAYEHLKYIYDILVDFDNIYKEEKKRLGIAEFNDIMHLALELLVDEENNLTDVARDYQKRFLEVYTDEYQDTSFVQETILEAVSGSKNRFMVGDIKQSIYRFRQARPEIFNEKYISYEKYNRNSDKDNVKIILSKNFRSRDSVINSINYIFEKIMSMSVGECNYTEDETLKCGNEVYSKDEENKFCTSINIINIKKDENKLGSYEDVDEENDEIEERLEEISNAEFEAKCIAYKIQDIIKNNKVSNSDGTLRDTTYRDIVILFRSIKNKSEIFEKALKESNIPVFTDKAESIFSGDEVKLVLSFLRILDNPYQDIYLVSIMYSIIGNFSLEEIAKVRLYSYKGNIYDTLIKISKDEEYGKYEPELLDKIRKFILLVEKYTMYSKIYTISQLLIRMYKDTQVYYQFALEDNSEAKKANLIYLIDLADKFYSDQGNTLSSYIRYIDNLKDKQDSSSAKVIGENENVVRIMTIHKSKGLEFPIVILADCAKKYNLKDNRDQISLHHKYGIGINIINKEFGVTYPSAIKQATKAVIDKETKSEELRLLYVALTRAKEQLYIYTTVNDYLKDYKEQTLLVRDGKINDEVIAKNQSYYKNILPVIKYYNEYDESTNIMKIDIVNVNSLTTAEELKNIILSSKEESERVSMSNRIDQIKKDTRLEEDIVIKENIKNNIDYKYHNDKDTIIPSRVSVSNLKKNHEEEIKGKTLKEYISDQNIDIERMNISGKYPRPELLKDDFKIYTPVRKGILIHFILEHLDFNKISSKAQIKEYIENLSNTQIINENDIKYININRIYEFLSSDIGLMIKEAKELYREYEFILKDEKFSNSEIQGVIDLFFVTNEGKVVLLDFKTDRIEDEDVFTKRYKLQLDIYKEAINRLTEYNVDETYIYSFNLNKAIRL